MQRLLLRAATTAALALILPLAAQSQQNTTTVIMGRVIVRETGLPLPYASITINGKNQQFTDSTGRFQIEGIATGEVTLRARRIGFSPGETKVEISRGDTARVAIPMTRLAIQLPAVFAVKKECRDPGAPGRGADPAVAQLYDQLRQNADHFRLLSVTYPYVYLAERQFVTSLNDSVIERTPLEQLTGSSARTWSYEPGKMVFENAATTLTNMHLPTLAVFADERFAETHCFEYGGTVELDGMQLVRMDFMPDDKLREPDIAGSIYLDPRTYQIRRSDITLSKVPYALSGRITGHTVTTYFTEIAPGIPIIGAFRAQVSKIRDGEVQTEMQRVVEVQFLRNRP